MYAEMVNFRPQSWKAASKLKPHRGLGTRRYHRLRELAKEQPLFNFHPFPHYDSISKELHAVFQPRFVPVLYLFITRTRNDPLHHYIMSRTSETDSMNDTPDLPPMQMMMLDMQKRQLKMQKQMASLMEKIISTTPSTNQLTLPPITGGRTQPVRLERPAIASDTSDYKWIIFQDAWDRYKEMAKLTSPRDIKNELRSACSASVNDLLYNFIGPDALHDADERDLLEYFKSVAVTSVHPEVYRHQFFVMR